jgi:hypothetical protein
MKQKVGPAVFYAAVLSSRPGFRIDSYFSVFRKLSFR